MRLADGWDQPQKGTHDQQHDRRCDTQALCDDLARKHRCAQEYDEFKTEHGTYSCVGRTADGSSAA
ncbi:hypothetical protein GCM10010303_40890 [Streptomyces purpurascens]|nr:hypothetical protein GCM10010303_40890 [Streptomyces purpurascens]